jgi:hypothetical protein
LEGTSDKFGLGLATSKYTMKKLTGLLQQVKIMNKNLEKWHIE